MVILEGLI